VVIGNVKQDSAYVIMINLLITLKCLIAAGEIPMKSIQNTC